MEYEVGSMVMRVFDCTGTLVMLAVAVAASVAAARIKHTKGPWLLALGMWGLAAVGMFFDVVSFADVDYAFGTGDDVVSEPELRAIFTLLLHELVASHASKSFKRK